MVNPSVKGLFFFAASGGIGHAPSEGAVLAIESRGTGNVVVEAGLRGGFGCGIQSVMIAEAVAKPRDISRIRACCWSLGLGGTLRARGGRGAGQRRARW